MRQRGVGCPESERRMARRRLYVAQSGRGACGVAEGALLEVGGRSPEVLPGDRPDCSASSSCRHAGRRPCWPGGARSSPRPGKVRAPAVRGAAKHSHRRGGARRDRALSAPSGTRRPPRLTPHTIPLRSSVGRSRRRCHRALRWPPPRGTLPAGARPAPTRLRHQPGIAPRFVPPPIDRVCELSPLVCPRPREDNFVP
jgi:hypothetical protein